MIGDDRINSAFAFLRLDDDERSMPVVANMTPIPREGYHIGVSLAEGATHWREMLNTDVAMYDGSDLRNSGVVNVDHVAAHG